MQFFYVEEAVVSGWGYRLQRSEKEKVNAKEGWLDTLRWTSVDILPRETCIKAYADAKSLLAVAQSDLAVWFDFD